MKLGKAKYWILAATVGATATTALWAYGQYKKMLKNITGYKSFTLKNFTAKNVAFQVVMTYKNNMDVDINLTNQEYDIYLNDIYATTLKNSNLTTLKAKETSDIPLSVSFDPKDLFNRLSINPTTFLMNPKNIIVKIDMRLKVKLLFFNIPIKYTYKDSMKRMMGLK